MQSVLKRGGMFWDRDLLPPQAYQERYRRMQAAIAEAGDDAWLIYGDVERHGFLTYVSNFFPRVRSAAALVPKSGAPTLLVNMGLRDIPACKQITWIEDVRPFLQLPNPLIALIEEKGLGKSRLGLIGADESMPITEWTAIEAGLPGVSFVARAEGLSALRQRKDSFELAAIRRAAFIVEEALDRAPRLIKPGVSMRQVVADLDRDIRRKAAEDVRVMVASGTQAGVALRPTDDRVLEKGDTVMLFIGAEVQRYWAEAARTYVIGAPSSALRALAARVGAAMAAMREAAVAGADTGQIIKHAKEKLGDAATSAMAYDFGHGIGLDPEEAPMFRNGAPGKLAEDCTLGLHLVAHSGGTGMAVGQTVVARKGRCESLNDAATLIECRA